MVLVGMDMVEIKFDFGTGLLCIYTVDGIKGACSPLNLLHTR